MGSWLTFFKKLLKSGSLLIEDESGQSTTEYVLILAASVVGASQLYRQLLGALDKGILRLGGDLEKDLKTGRVPINVWKN